MKFVVSRRRSVPQCFVLSMLLCAGYGGEARLHQQGVINKKNNKADYVGGGGRSATNRSSRRSLMTDLSIKAQAVLLESSLTEAITNTPWHGNTTTAYNEGAITIQSPSTNPDDVLFLFLSRSHGKEQTPLL